MTMTTMTLQSSANRQCSPGIQKDISIYMEWVQREKAYGTTVHVGIQPSKTDFLTPRGGHHLAKTEQRSGKKNS